MTKGSPAISGSCPSDASEIASLVRTPAPPREAPRAAPATPVHNGHMSHAHVTCTCHVHMSHVTCHMSHAHVTCTCHVHVSHAHVTCTCHMSHAHAHAHAHVTCTCARTLTCACTCTCTCACTCCCVAGGYTAGEPSCACCASGGSIGGHGY